jgi:glycosyltransferase involved in cell wall biosynthesis
VISILIPCHNARQWIGAAIESALGQTHPHCEVMVADDGSTDGSLDVIRSYGERIEVLALPHSGATAARNALLSRARGEWVQYLDADDLLEPEKIARQVAALPKHPDADVLYGPVTMLYCDGSGETGREVVPIPEPHDPWILLARWYLPQTGAPLWRRQALVDVGGWTVDQPCCQEHELYLRLLIAGKRFVYAPAGGAVYRQWSETTLWKRDRSRTRRERLKILDRAEAHLRAARALTPERLQAINLGRFETARSAWASNPAEGRAAHATIRPGWPRFRPQGPAAPPLYRATYGVLGFAAAERLAALRRSLLRGAP